MGAVECTICTEPPPPHVKVPVDNALLPDEVVESSSLSEELQMLHRIAYFLKTSNPSTRSDIWNGLDHAQGQEMIQDLVFDCARAYMKVLNCICPLLSHHTQTTCTFRMVVFVFLCVVFLLIFSPSTVTPQCYTPILV